MYYLRFVSLFCVLAFTNAQYTFWGSRARCPYIMCGPCPPGQQPNYNPTTRCRQYPCCLGSSYRLGNPDISRPTGMQQTSSDPLKNPKFLFKIKGEKGYKFGTTDMKIANKFVDRVRDVFSGVSFSHRGVTDYDPWYWTDKKDNNDNVYYVPYKYDESTTNKVNNEIKIAFAAAIADIEANTCIRFVERTDENDYIYVRSDSSGGCSSYVGNIGGDQELNLAYPGCATKGIAIHEILHALGFFHEHQRSDRDQYVDILTENIRSGAEGNFVKRNTLSFNSPYDFSSVMHYRSNSFSSNSEDTIVPKNPNINKGLLGQRNGLSVQDIYQLNAVYTCDGTIITPPDPTTCIDIETRKCGAWKRKGHCNSGKSKFNFMEINCRKTCDLCLSIATVPPQNTCENYYDKACGYVFNKNLCGKYGDGCRKKCDLCGSSQNPSNDGGKDKRDKEKGKKNDKNKNTSNNNYTSQGRCMDILSSESCKRYAKVMKQCNQPYVRSMCKKTCRLC